jgi:integrase
MREQDIKGHVRKRGSKLELVIWVDGRRVTRSTGLDVGQEAEAQALLDATIAELRTAPAAPVPAAPDTLRAWGERWIEDRKARGKLEYVHEQSHLEHFVYPLLGDKPLAACTDVVILDWARGLEKQKGPSGKHPSPKYVRKITATVRALFKEAVRRHVIERSPCIWEDTDLPELEANARVMGCGFERADVQRLIYDSRIPEDRRVLYALEFLTGMRTGEAAARRWEDWADVEYRGDLGRLVARTAYNTRHRIVKTTKTRVEKWIPVHPALAEILTAWKAEGWERFWGRPPRPDDLIVPSATGKPRNNAFSWRAFRDDLVTLGIAHQRHYETRSTFINLAEGGGASPEDVHRLTHASLGEAKDLYRRVPQQWPRLCKAVRAIQIGPPAEVSQSVSQPPGEAPAEADESSDIPGGWALTGSNGRAGESNPPTAPLSTIHRF